MAFESSITIRDVVPAEDGEAVAAIYNHYIAGTTITFEEQPIHSDEMASRIADITQGGLPFLVAESEGDVRGYAYATKWKGRSAYRFSVEVSVYLDAAHYGKGLGSALYTELFRRLQDMDMHTIIGGIALPNDASIALHERFGLTKIAHFREVGFKFDRWIDVGYWERIL